MHADNDADAATFTTLLARQMQWAKLSVTLDEIAADNTELVRDLSRYDSTTTLPFLAGLMTLPAYQSHCVRFEILVALAVIHCHGSKTPSVRHAQRWFEELGRSSCARAEDPAEDVFVSLVHDRSDDYRLLDGSWESAAFYTQRFLDVIARMSPTDHTRQMQRTVRALLVVSDIACAQANLSRYQLGSDALPGAVSFRNLPGRDSLISRVTIRLDDLYQRGVTAADIAPFFLTQHMVSEIPVQQFGCTNLDYHPLVKRDDSTIILALPTAPSVALRNYAISIMTDVGRLDEFDDMLARDYELLLADTPLFGGPLRVPIRWRKVGKHRTSTICFAADKGHYIAMHLFLPSMYTHSEGGFKDEYKVEEILTKATQQSVDAVCSRLANEPDFRKGLAVLVGCGWGKGYVSDMPRVNNDRWYLQSISVADLILLSQIAGMSPGYFWRLTKGLEVITKAGVHIQNFNGILNLIAWVRSNRGHFVPHEQLTDFRISPHQPLWFNPPLNMLRDLRAEVAQGYDGHCSMDNKGRLHYVQRWSLDPFFKSSSGRRLYVSRDDVREGKLTCVYEGVLSIWMSIDTPRIAEHELTYRLWEMACEWLHRIGDVLGKLYHEWSAASALKLYVQFRDGEPSGNPGAKPTRKALENCCGVVSHREPNACCAIFEIGFLAGFGIAENVAERLVVRTLTRAILFAMSVDDVDRRADVVSSEVVKSHDARQFHLIHSQTFTDYVADALPKKLITIDAIDEAAARIGLGTHALGEKRDSLITGRGACTEFMNRVVDDQLDAIVDELHAFERLSILRALVGNCLKAAAERDHWKRTSAAVLGLHGDTEETLEQFVKQMGVIGAAAATCRVLVEIALCVCPLGGGTACCDLDIGGLMARAGIVCRIGGLSDAIHYGALAPKIRVSPLGDVLVADDFGRFVVEPMLSHMVRDKVTIDAPLQKNNYDAPSAPQGLRELVGEEFWTTWKTEMKFDLNEASEIVGALGNRGMQEGIPILEITRSEYLRAARSVGVENQAAERFLERFSLRSRRDWRTPPKRFARKELYPWRFGRSLSYLARPILQVDDEDDPLLMIAPAALQTGLSYVVSGGHSGRLDRSFFRTKKMRNEWLGRAREGHSFNRAVAQRLAGANWRVRENIGLPEIFGRATARDGGDVDVLAWKSGRRKVLVIECKDLALARNYSEMAALLSDYQGVVDRGRRDKLRRHLDRVGAIRENLERLGRFTGVAEPEVVSCLICSGVVPMQYAKIDALARTLVGTVEDVLASV